MLVVGRAAQSIEDRPQATLPLGRPPLAAGTCKVAVDGCSSALAGLMPTNPEQGGDLHFDSNPSPARVTLNNNLDQRLQIDFGYMSVPAGSIEQLRLAGLQWKRHSRRDRVGYARRGRPARRLDNSVIATLLTGSDGIYCLRA